MQKLGTTMNRVTTPTPDLGAGRTSARGLKSDVDGPKFREQLEALKQAHTQAGQPGGLGAKSSVQSPLKFSNHAIDRMQSRGIRFSPEDMGKIQGAVSKAAGKGSKDALLITDSAALIVSVKDNTVVTVMDKASLKDNVFTNIDSTVMI